MFQKALKIAATLGILLAGYAGYVRGFAIVMSRVGRPSKIPQIHISTEPSANAKKATELAELAFSKGHWSANPNDSFRYYEPQRGYWLYARNYEALEGNKKLKLTPFVMISRTRVGGPIKTMTGNEALLEFDKPLEPSKPGTSEAHLIRARINGDVMIRDDKGTPRRLDDDLHIGPLVFPAFDEAKLKITGAAPPDSPVRIKDKGIFCTGWGELEITLQPKGPGQGSGFEPRTASLERDVLILMDDVGQSGVVPGAAAANVPAGKREPKPGELKSRGKMIVYLPKPAGRCAGGPQAPKDPTEAEFFQNVMVRQGVVQPDQLNSDFLHLDLVSAEKEPAPTATSANPSDVGAPNEPPAEQGADDGLGSLTLSSARASGHAVWVHSPSQGLRAKGNELIYERRLPEQPDKTYFRADRNVWVEKISYITEGPDKGKIESIDEINTMDLTIFQFGPNGAPPAMIGRGPGTLETRADRGMPIDRTASWNDRLEVQTVRTLTGERRKITLIGLPKVHSMTQGSLEVREKIIAYLKPKEATATRAEVQVDGKPLAADASDKSSAADVAAKPAPRAGDTFQIEWLEAHKDVVLETVEQPPAAQAGGAGQPPRKKNGKQTVKARERLDVVFTPTPRPPAPAAEPEPVKPADPGAPLANAAAATDVAENAKPTDAAQAAEPPPDDPPLVAEGDEAWARVMVYPDDERSDAAKNATPGTKAPQGYVQKAYLRGNATIHQGPEAGKKRGTDVTADEVDMEDQGDSRSKVDALGTIENPAVAITDGFTIKGPLLGLDQAHDYAWAKGGPGMLIQEREEPDPKVAENPKRAQAASTGERDPAASDKAKGAPKAKPARDRVAEKDAKDTNSDQAEPAKAKPQPRGPMTITWKREMQFFGKTEDELGIPGPAKAIFYEDVHAWTDDSTVDCNEMHAMLDRPVSFQKRKGNAPRDANGKDGEPEPEAKLSWLKCLEFRPEREVVIVRYVVDPASKLLLIEDPEKRPDFVKLFTRYPNSPDLKNKDQINGHDVYYDMKTGDYDVLGKGIVRHYARKGEDEKATGQPSSEPVTRPVVPNPTAGVRVRPVSDSPKTAQGAARSKTQAKAKTKGSSAAKKKPKENPPAKAKPVKPEVPPLELLRITFDKRMVGKFGGAVEADAPKGPSNANFEGDILLLHATVANSNTDLDPDALVPPSDQMRLSCRFLEVTTWPSTVEGQPDPYWVKGWRDVAAQDGVKIVQGDRLTYDSNKELAWVYGEEGRLASITQQAMPGGIPSTTPGSAIMYNRKTGRSQVVNARELQFIDARGAKRIEPTPPDITPEMRIPRQEPRLPGRADKERRGMKN